MDTNIGQLALDELFEMRNRINMDVAFQRQYVWDMKKDRDHRMSKLIRSALLGFYIPHVLFWDNNETNDNGSVYGLIDGKQRLTTFFLYIEGGFKLSEEIEYGEYSEDVRGKFFAELPEEVQKKIMRHKINITYIKNASTKEIEENFVLINEGVPLSKTEKSVAKLGGDNNKKVQEMVVTKFFKKAINFSDSDKKKQMPRSVAMQIIALRSNNGEARELGDIDLIATDIAENGISEEVFTQIKAGLAYLEKAFPSLDKGLNKLRIPMIFEASLKAIENNVSPIKFSNWAHKFFNDLKAVGKGTPIDEASRHAAAIYREGTGAGTGKVSSVASRLEGILEHYNANIDKMPETREEEQENTTRSNRRQSRRAS